MKVRPVTDKDQDGNPLSLSLETEYEVLEIECNLYRLLNDPDKWPYGNDPVLFEPELFEVTDAREPEFWITETIDGDRYSSPPGWKDYLLEKYHDRNKEAHKAFWDSIKKLYPWTWNQRFGS